MGGSMAGGSMADWLAEIGAPGLAVALEAKG